MVEERIGIIEHYWPRVQAAAIRLEGHDIHQGDRIHVRGRDHDFEQEVDSIQIEHAPCEEAHPGEPVAIHVAEPVRPHDEVFLVRDGS